MPRVPTPPDTFREKVALIAVSAVIATVLGVLVAICTWMIQMKADVAVLKDNQVTQGKELAALADDVRRLRDGR